MGRTGSIPDDPKDSGQNQNGGNEDDEGFWELEMAGSYSNNVP